MKPVNVTADGDWRKPQIDKDLVANPNPRVWQVECGAPILHGRILHRAAWGRDLRPSST